MQRFGQQGEPNSSSINPLILEYHIEVLAISEKYLSVTLEIFAYTKMYIKRLDYWQELKGRT